MKKGWFQHTDLTEHQANELVAQYAARNVKTEKSLAPDYLSWTVSALLPEGKRPPRAINTYQWKFWRKS